MKCTWLEALLLLNLWMVAFSRPVLDNSEILQVIKDISSLDSLISENDAADNNDDDDDYDKDDSDAQLTKDSSANSTKKALIHNSTVSKGVSTKDEISKVDKESEVDSIPVGQRLTSEQKIEKPNVVDENKSHQPETQSKEITNAKNVGKLTGKNKPSQELNVTGTDSSTIRDQKSKASDSDNENKKSNDVTKTKSLISKNEEKDTSFEEGAEEEDEEELKETNEDGSGSEEDTETKSSIETKIASENKTPTTEDETQDSESELSSVESSSIESPAIESEEAEPEDKDEKVKMFFISPFEKNKDEESTARQVLTYPATSHGSSIHHHGSPSHIWSSDYPYFAYGYSWGCGNHINGEGHHGLKKSKVKDHEDSKKSDLLCRDYMLLPAITPAAIRAVEEKEENAKTRQNVIAKDIACDEDDTACTQRQVIGNMAGGSLFGDGMGGLGMGFPGVAGIHTGVSGYNLAGGLGHGHDHGGGHEYGHGDPHGYGHGFHHGHEYQHGYGEVGDGLGDGFGGGYGNGLDGGFGGYGGGLGHYALSNERKFPNSNEISNQAEKAEKKANVKNEKRKAKKKHVVGTLEDENGLGYQGVNRFGGDFGNSELTEGHGFVGSRIGYPLGSGVANGIYGEAIPNVLGVGLKNKNLLNVDAEYSHALNNGPNYNLASSNLGGMISDRLNNFGGGNMINGGNFPFGTGEEGRVYNNDNDADYEPESGNIGDGVGHPYFPNSHVEEDDGYGPPIMGPPLRNAFGYSSLDQSFQNYPGAMKFGYGGSIGHIGGLEVNGIHSNFAYKSKIKKKKNKKQVRGNVRQDIAMPDEQAMMDVTKQRQLIGSLGASTLFSDNVGGMGLGYPGIPGMSSGISGIPGEYGGNGGYAHGWDGHGTGLHPHGYNNYGDEESHGGDFGGFGNHGEEGSHEGGYERSFDENAERENQQNHEQGIS